MTMLGFDPVQQQQFAMIARLPDMQLSQLIGDLPDGPAKAMVIAEIRRRQGERGNNLGTIAGTPPGEMGAPPVRPPDLPLAMPPGMVSPVGGDVSRETMDTASPDPMAGYSAGGMGIGYRPPQLPLSPALQSIGEGTKAAETASGRIAQIANEMMEGRDSKFDAFMSIAKAGFGAAAGQSPYALQNIGQGALIGLDEYSRARERGLLQRIKGAGLALGLEELDAKREASNFITGKDGAVYRVNKTAGTLQTLVPPTDRMPKIGEVRKINRGGEEVAESWDGQKWEIIGSGPRWKDEDPLVEVVSPDDPTKTVMMRRSQAEGQEGKGSFGTVVVTGPDGRQMVMSGNSRALSGLMTQQLQPGAKTEVQKSIVRGLDHLSGLTSIVSQFDPAFHQWGPQLQNWFTSVKERAGIKPSEEQTKALNAYSEYLSAVGQKMSEIRHDLFGATLTQGEQKAASQFIIDGSESPTQAQAKATAFMKTMKRAIARNMYINQKGLSIQEVTLDAMDTKIPQMVRERGDQLARELGKRGMTGKELEAAVMQRLGDEFGLLLK